MNTDIKIAIIVGVLVFIGVITSEKKYLNIEEQEQNSFCSSELAKSVIGYNFEKCTKEFE